MFNFKILLFECRSGKNSLKRKILSVRSLHQLQHDRGDCSGAQSQIFHDLPSELLSLLGLSTSFSVCSLLASGLAVVNHRILVQDPHRT
jgi:hypothetical protein